VTLKLFKFIKFRLKRVSEKNLSTQREKARKRIIRAYQSKHNGKHPTELKQIPVGYYCIDYTSDGGEKRLCSYYSKIKYKEAIILYGENTVSWAREDYNISKEAGACSLLMTNDYIAGEHTMFSLLWDGCKSCPFNPEPPKKEAK